MPGGISAYQSDARHDHRWLLAAIVIASLVHGLFFFFRPSVLSSPDEREYISLAINLADRGEFVLPDGLLAKRMPVYPLLLSWVRRWQGPDLWTNAALLLQTGMALCSTIIIALIARRLSDGLGGFVAGVTAALYSPFLYLQMSFLTEGVLIFLLSLSILFYIAWMMSDRSTKQEMLALLGISSLLGIATLTRPNALLFLIPFLTDAVLRTGRWTRRALRVAALTVPAAACVIGWGVRNQREMGAFVLSTSGGLNFHLGNNPSYAKNPRLDQADYDAGDRLRAEDHLTEIESDKRLYDTGRRFIREHPGEAAVNVLRKIGVWFTPSVPSQGPTLVILVATLIVTAGWSSWRHGTLPYASKMIFACAAILLIISLAAWLLRLRETILPFTTPLYVLSLGVPALVFLPSSRRIKWLFIGLVLTQLLTSVVYIPLTRIRWTIDALFIIAIAVWTSQLCRSVKGRTGDQITARSTR